MIKQVKTQEESYLEFSDDELEFLGIKKGDKFEVIDRGDGSIILKPFSAIEIDLNALSKEYLISLIQRSEEQDQTFGDTIVEILTDAVKDFEEFGF